MTHAFFKALLFLGAGSVIIALHHEQDLRKMGGLRKYMPITYWTARDRLARAGGHPAVRGILLEGRDHRGRPLLDDSRPRLRVLRGDGRRVRHGVLLVPDAVPRVPRQGALPDDARDHGEQAHDASHGATEPDAHARPRQPPKESPWVVTVPLILLAIPSVYAGWAYIEPMLIGDFFGDSIVVAPEHPAIEELREEWHGIGAVHRCTALD